MKAFPTKLALFAVLILLLFSSCASLSPSPDLFPAGEWKGNTLVSTAYGSLDGAHDRNHTLSWFGIPYAKPPVEELRWQKPQAQDAWRGIRPARQFGSKSAQRSMLFGFATGSEDCLYLNVWRPETVEKGLPVYVWIHGGANTSGSADISPEYKGQSLAAKANLVYVSINYRLDVFGWFAHPALRTGDPETDSGNFGTLDLIAALEWVRDNIAAFGGDPGNVTIAGESAGAMNVLTLLIAPRAKGLFHRAVVESGYTRIPKVGAVDFAENLGLRLAISQGKAANEGEAKAFAASMKKEEAAKWLREASPAELLKLSKPGSKTILSLPSPIFDGNVLPADGFAALADPKRSADVPLIIGTNKEEAKLFLFFLRQNSRKPLYQALSDVTSALWKAEGADAVADAIDERSLARHVYVYRFDWGAPDTRGVSVQGGRTGAKIGAAHSIEIAFFLQNDTVYGNALPLPIFTKANEKGRLALQEKMGSYLSNFIRGGDPNGKSPGAQVDQVLWEPWDAKSTEPPFIVFNADFVDAHIKLERGRTTKESVLRGLMTATSPDFKEKYKEITSMF